MYSLEQALDLYIEHELQLLQVRRRIEDRILQRELEIDMPDENVDAFENRIEDIHFAMENNSSSEDSNNDINTSEEERYLLPQDDEVQAHETEQTRASRQDDEMLAREGDQRRSSQQDGEVQTHEAEQTTLDPHTTAAHYLHRAREAEQRHLSQQDNEVQAQSHPSFNNTANMNPPEQEESQEQQVIQNPEHIVPPQVYYVYVHLRWKFQLTQ
jgi:SOS-response transcriptional repressor LexA